MFIELIIDILLILGAINYGTVMILGIDMLNVPVVSSQSSIILKISIIIAGVISAMKMMDIRSRIEVKEK